MVEDLGGESTPSIGFAAGVERLIMALDIDSHDFALKIVKEDGLFVARPEYL